MGIRIISLIVLLSLFFGPAKSQYYESWRARRLEVFGGFGSSNYYGDVGGANKETSFFLVNTDLENTMPSVALGMRFKFSKRVALKTNIIGAVLKGNNQNSYQQDIPYKFSTTTIEVSAHGEYYFKKDQKLTVWEKKNYGSFKRINMANYVFGGLGLSYFIPNAEDSDGPLNTSPVPALAFPIGIGTKFFIKDHSYYGFEIGYRFTATNFIDYDNPPQSPNDTYLFIQINYGLKLQTAVNKNRKKSFETELVKPYSEIKKKKPLKEKITIPFISN